MTKLLTAFCLTIVFCDCNNQTISNSEIPTKNQSKDTTSYKGLHGTWVRQNKAGFTLIEIKDTLTVSYYQLLDREAELNKPYDDRFWYYKSKATMGYWDSLTIWIATDKFRFDYRIKNDTLIEFDKMGDQGKFIKVYTDEEKAFTEFNSANLKGKITYVNKVEPSEYFVLDNADKEYSFTSIASKASNNKTFSDIAEVGDSVCKQVYADTLTLYKQKTKQYLKFVFVRR